MRETSSDVQRWMRRAKREKASHIIVVCDTFNYENYPVYIGANVDLQETVAMYNHMDMQRVERVIEVR